MNRVFLLLVVGALVGCGQVDERIHCVSFDPHYQSSYGLYLSVPYPDKKQIRDYYVNGIGRAGRGGDGAYADRSQFVLEVYNVETDDLGVAKKNNGRMIKTNLSVVSVMEKNISCARELDQALVSGGWSYAFFNVTGADITQEGAVVDCVGCHSEKAMGTDFVISSPELDDFFGALDK